MSLGEPQYPRKLVWWEYTEAKTVFFVRVFFIGMFIATIMCVLECIE